MKRHFLGSSVAVASILLGWVFFTIGRDWFMIYVLFGGGFIMAFFALLDDKKGAESRSNRPLPGK